VRVTFREWPGASSHHQLLRTCGSSRGLVMFFSSHILRNFFLVMSLRLLRHGFSQCRQEPLGCALSEVVLLFRGTYPVVYQN
jgi:hypothetical protein